MDPRHGLSDGEVSARRAASGPNLLRRTGKRSAASVLVDQFRSLVVLLLAVAAALSLALGELAEAIAVAVVLVLNGALGFATELRAIRSMEALRTLGHTRVTVRRDGSLSRIGAEGLVPGDIVVLEAGDVISADLRLLQAAGVRADESVLTGESVPVAKDSAALAGVPPLSERTNMLFKGTSLTAGSAEAVVTGTGMATEIGRITALVEGAEVADTPLEKRLDRLARALSWAALGFVAAIVVIGVLSGGELWLMVETGIALVVAAVPEGLPVVATLALARGMWRMARRNALIEQLPAVETLGSTDLILTDKTGTLTENRMTVVRIEVGQDRYAVSGIGLELTGAFTSTLDPVGRSPQEALRELPGALIQLLSTAALCTDAELGARAGAAHAVGDPMEVALLVAAHKAGLSRTRLRSHAVELRQVAFESATKMMATFHRKPDHLFVAVKGAPESVIAACEAQQTAQGVEPLAPEASARLLARAVALADQGLRVLAVASRTVSSIDEAPYESLTFLGLLGLLDPPRTEILPAIRACQRAGIRVVMVTGDHAGTASAIATAVGLVPDGEVVPRVVLGAELDQWEAAPEQQLERLLEAHVVARCDPEQKLRLLALFQQRGHTVAMVGDGVNDAPSLRRADIGIAMGLRGTEVAREAAAMVLRDDDFRTIAVAIEQGRVIYSNIRRFVIYLVSCNLSEILTVGLASMVGAPLPILPMQILFLNLVTDVFPALALAAGEGDPSVMLRPPRPSHEPLLTRSHVRGALGYGALLAAAVLCSFAVARGPLALGDGQAVSVAFLVLAFSQLLHVFNMAGPGAQLLRNEITRNPWVWGAVALCAALVAAGFFIPALGRVLSLENPGWAAVATALFFSSVPLLVGRAQALLRVGAAGPS